MRTRGKLSLLSGRYVAAVIIIGAAAGFTGALARPVSPHHAFLGGPWELLVKLKLEGQGLKFPIEVDDEDKPQKLDKLLPVLGTPIKIKLEHYLPDLKWQTTPVEQPGGGAIADLTVKGQGLDERIWLDSDDRAKQYISSEVGGVGIKKLQSSATIEALVKKLKGRAAVGVLSVRPEGGDSPLEYVIDLSKKTTIKIPKSPYKLKVLKYLPHYSIDTKTKKVSKGSDKPVNPAIRIRLDDGKTRHEQWLWSKFASPPHMKKKLPLHMKFTDFDLGGEEGKYIIAVAAGAEPQLVFAEKGKMRTKKLVLGESYPFTNKEYSFTVEKILESGVLKKDWKNNTEKLLHPAIVVTIERNGVQRQSVLELNKPYHDKAGSETMVLMYRRKVEPLEDG